MAQVLTSKAVEGFEPQTKRYSVNDSKVGGLKVRVEPTGRKNYYVYYRINGRATQVKLGSTLELTVKEARDRALKVLLKARDGVSEAKERKQRECETLGGFLTTRYKGWVLANHRRPEDDIRTLENTFKHWHTKRLDELTKATVDQWRAKQTLSPASINKYVGALKTALFKAVEWELIDHNPLQGLAKMKQPEVVPEWLDKRQVAQLEKALYARDRRKTQERKQYNQWLRERGRPALPEPVDYECPYFDYLTPIVTVALNTGMRLGELLDLEWDDVKEHLITVRRSKSGKVRYIPLNFDAQSTLFLWKRYSQRYNYDNVPQRPTKHVFVKLDSGRPMKSVKTAWRNLTNETPGLQGKGFHILRKSFGSELIRQKQSVYVVSKLMGHSSIAVTEKHYLALLQDENRAAVDTLGPIF